METRRHDTRAAAIKGGETDSGPRRENPERDPPPDQDPNPTRTMQRSPPVILHERHAHQEKSRDERGLSPDPCGTPTTAGGPPLRVFTNSRERWRQKNVNGAFKELRRLLPTHPPDRKLSKKEVLNRALRYISFLDQLLSDQDLQKRAAAPRPRSDSLEDEEEEEEEEVVESRSNFLEELHLDSW